MSSSRATATATSTESAKINVVDLLIRHHPLLLDNVKEFITSEEIDKLVTYHMNLQDPVPVSFESFDRPYRLVETLVHGIDAIHGIVLSPSPITVKNASTGLAFELPTWIRLPDQQNLKLMKFHEDSLEQQQRQQQQQKKKKLQPKKHVKSKKKDDDDDDDDDVDDDDDEDDDEDDGDDSSTDYDEEEEEEEPPPEEEEESHRDNWNDEYEEKKIQLRRTNLFHRRLSNVWALQSACYAEFKTEPPQGLFGLDIGCMAREGILFLNIICSANAGERVEIEAKIEKPPSGKKKKTVTVAARAKEKEKVHNPWVAWTRAVLKCIIAKNDRAQRAPIPILAFGSEARDLCVDNLEMGTDVVVYGSNADTKHIGRANGILFQTFFDRIFMRSSLNFMFDEESGCWHTDRFAIEKYEEWRKLDQSFYTKLFGTEIFL